MIFTVSKYTWSFGFSMCLPFLLGPKKKVVTKVWKDPSHPSPPSLSLLWALSQRLTPFGSLVALYLLGLPPSRAPFGLSFFLSQKTPRGSQGPVAGLPGRLTEAVLSNRKACGVPGWERGGHYQSRAVKSQEGEGEPARAGRTELKWRFFFFFPCSCCCHCWRERSWTSAQTHAELKKQQDKFLKNELGEGKELGVGSSSEKEPGNDSNPQTKEAPADQPSPSPAFLWFKYWFV